MRYPLAFALLLCLTVPGASEAPAKPWANDDEKLRFMLKMSHNLIAPIKEDCAERTLARLKKAGDKETPATKEADSCASSVTSCGTCHLPRANNNTYRITIKNQGEFTGKVIADGEKLKFQPTGATAASEIAPNEIRKTEWVGGEGDSLARWNFKKLGSRARVVKKMLALAAKNNVGCTNCHVEQGNFKLNENGKLFDETGEVKRQVTLEKFLK